MLTDRIRELVTQYAALPTDGPDEVEDLGFVFSDVSDIETSDSKKVERGRQLQIRDGAYKIKKRSFWLIGQSQLEVGWVPACKEVKKEEEVWR